MENTDQNSVDSKINEPEAVSSNADAVEAAASGNGDESAQASGAGQSGDNDVAALIARVSEAEAKAGESWDQLLRARADLENMRRRMERDVEKAHKFALEGFAQELLAVTDSLELGLDAARDENASIDKLVEGTALTLKMLKTTMEKFNIKEVDPVGQAFNPELHQAMTMQESAEQPPNTVITVFQKGYLLNDRLIRPARVVVSKAPVEKAPEGDQEGEKIGGNINEQA